MSIEHEDAGATGATMSPAQRLAVALGTAETPTPMTPDPTAAETDGLASGVVGGSPAGA